jgi:hypothetical protein
MTAEYLAAEAVRSVVGGEKVRDKCRNIKTDLNKRIRLGLYIGKVAVQRLAMRATAIGDIEHIKTQLTAIPKKKRNYANKLSYKNYLEGTS